MKAAVLSVRWIWAAAFAVFCLSTAQPIVSGAPESELWERWLAHDESNPYSVNHGTWTWFLERYSVTDDISGINKMRYRDVHPGERVRLGNYIAGLQVHPLSKYRRSEQLAIWINLYNAITVGLVIDHPGSASIRDIDISPGWFVSGPWDAPVAKIEGVPITLNDIEHRILRPIWKDARIHYSLNCASMGCPNLAVEAYTAENTERLLEDGAKAYINHPRGVHFEDGQLVLSSLYGWYEEDFGGESSHVIRHLLEFAEPQLAGLLRNYTGDIDYAYDWRLNIAERQ